MKGLLIGGVAEQLPRNRVLEVPVFEVPVEVRGFEPLAPTLRTRRPYPSDRVICALTGNFVLIASHCFAWFLSVSRAERAQSCG